ncbi:hypothetical protein FOHLNKBM_2414 [Methylobacterium longum]|nr:hypothetical protein FOHLNKBM_2414 [Methylobacterium longum]
MRAAALIALSDGRHRHTVRSPDPGRGRITIARRGAAPGIGTAADRRRPDAFAEAARCEARNRDAPGENVPGTKPVTAPGRQG